MNNYENKIKLKFKLLAVFYDLFDLLFLLSKKKNPRDVLASKISNDDLSVLDVCVGTASSSIKVAKKNNRNRIIGIDLSKDMIAVAEKKVQKQNIKNISFQYMDATKMAFQDKTFDIVMVSFGLHELDFELMNIILQEISRVIKPNGKLYILDYEKEKGLLKGIAFWVFLKILEPKHIFKFLKYDWRDILKEIGFEIDGIEAYFFSKLISARVLNE